MVSINEIIKREVNPFDLVNIRVGNFWTENQDYTALVESIHQAVINEVEGLLDLVVMDNRSRTVLLLGDGGSGKSYLLGRLKQTFNTKAFFTYISPWSDNDYIWRHVLRYTVDSLIQVPEGQQESQLILWLKSLSAFTKRKNSSIWQVLLNDRKKFISHLKNTYKLAGIYNADIFFGLLYDLTDPELYPLACEWLRGDDLSEESMQTLNVKSCIDTEDAAKNILANFGKISIETQPIVLCFDQVESTAKFDLNPQPLFNINTTIHNDNLKNFLIIITIVKDNWMRATQIIPQTDKVRLERLLQLRPINLEQAEAIWAYRLQSLHQEANPQPNISIFPLEKILLEDNFPGGKTYPRNAIILGRQKYQEYKLSLLTKPIVIQQPNSTTPNIVIIPPTEPLRGSPRENYLAEFKIIWQKELKKTQEKITKITFVAANELIQMLQMTLEALQMQSIKPKLISGKSASSSFSYQSPKQGKVGVVWTEDPNMTSFFNIMNATHKVAQKGTCSIIYLIRLSTLGNAKLKGFQLYSQIFNGTKNIHIRPKLPSVHILETYRNLVNSTLSQELVIGGKTIQLPELQSLVRESKVLEKCVVIQDLGVVTKLTDTETKKDLRVVKEFLRSLVVTQNFMGVQALYSHAKSQFYDVSDNEIRYLIELLCEERKIKFINPKAKLEDQLVCLVA
ncbi:ATP-binding protein [Brunnivagina elsteri]|uniref:KAP family P-loop domain-containing protein n=1 Tax=Brunnivagina elsteri CCALA 953 TaxID=987040 RepID=A0A2A2TG30_9CYAN|nr:ATP-binding protein [Calothrix elsteri]PAX52379.1 KAP family P-loop domain-containing protein [Calothrix elsteri CCALA 953]